MNKFYVLLVFLCFCGLSVSAQNDTLLFEDFNYGFDSLPDASDNVAGFALGDDTTWVNIDEDGIATDPGDPGNWFWDATALRDLDSAQGGVLLSLSWLQNFAPGNRNWLITPPITLVDDQAVLSWKSAPFQGPRYLDGYLVLVSTTVNDPTASMNPFTDTIFQAAQMTGFVGDGQTTVIDSFSFSPGYIHANNYTDSTYFEFTGTTVNYGLLEPHSVSLAQYSGQTVYIAFLHNSDDDYYFSLDDILVTGTEINVSAKDQLAFEADVNVFPNPARNILNVNYEVNTKGDVHAMIVDVQGRVVREMNTLSSDIGTFQHTFEVADLAAGAYQLVLIQNGEQIAKPFIKQ